MSEAEIRHPGPGESEEDEIEKLILERGCAVCGGKSLTIKKEKGVVTAECADCGQSFSVRMKLEFDLSPCPFCGQDNLDITFEEDGTADVLCLNEECQAVVSFDNAFEIEETVDAWNQRKLKKFFGEVPPKAHVIQPYTTLQACPFCGNIAVKQLLFTKKAEFVSGKIMKIPKYASAIRCAECGALTWFGYSNGLNMVTDRWNVRNGKERF